MEKTFQTSVTRRSVLALCIGAALATAADATARPSPPLEPWTPTTPTAIVTSCDDSGPGSLRDAVNNAVDGDTIDLTQLGCSRITLTTGAITIGVTNIAFQGPGPNQLAIDGNDNDTVLWNLGGGTTIIEGLTIENGHKYVNDQHVRGGCINTNGNALLRNVHVRDCTAQSASNLAALGGGIYTQGALLLYDSIVSNNTAHATGNGYASGGGIYAHDFFVSSYSTISNNVAVGDSSTPSFGGGALTWNGGQIIGTAVWGNTSTRMGGLALYGDTSHTTTMINSTISGNSATRFGGVFARTVLDLYNSTIAFNHATEWTNGTENWAAGLQITSGLGHLYSTIINNNINDALPGTADLAGPSGTGFLGSNNNVGFCGAPCPNDTTHEDPGLGPLQDNGGRSRTHVPTPGLWDTFGGVNVLGWQWEQRGPGFLRDPPADRMDIGAYQTNSDVILANGFN